MIGTRANQAADNKPAGRRARRITVLAATAGALTIAAMTSSALASTATTNHAPIGHLDSVSAQGPTVTVRGWAADPDATHSSIAVKAVFTPNLLGSADNYVTNISHDPRPDVAAAYPAYGPNHGFNFSIETYQAGTSTLCLYGIDLTGGPNSLLGCQRITIGKDHPAIGHLDSVTAVGNDHVEIRGWAADQDTPSTAVSVSLLLGGATSNSYYNAIATKASQSRPDVASAYPALGPNHGFDVTVAAKPGRYPICASALDTASNHHGPSNLGCVTVTVS